MSVARLVMIKWQNPVAKYNEYSDTIANELNVVDLIYQQIESETSTDVQELNKYLDSL